MEQRPDAAEFDGRDSGGEAASIGFLGRIVCDVYCAPLVYSPAHERLLGIGAERLGEGVFGERLG